jgi:hypothetical protein
VGKERRDAGLLPLTSKGIAGFKDKDKMEKIEEKLLRTNALLEKIRNNQRGQFISAQQEQPATKPAQSFVPSTVDYGDATHGRSDPLGEFRGGGGDGTGTPNSPI